MKTAHLLSAFVAATLGLAASAALAEQVNSIRGTTPEEQVDLTPVYHQMEGRAERNFRLQPPIIPHTIDKYQIDLKANECLSCHDWKTAADRKAPTLSMTHYVGRDGVQTETVNMGRWFCNQCHVMQVDAPELVENTFTGLKN